MSQGELDNHHIALQDVYMLSPTVVNEARGGVTTSKRFRMPEQHDRNYNLEVLGIKGTGSDFNPLLYGYARTTINGYAMTGLANMENSSERQWNFVDILSTQTGNHALKFGVDYYRQGYVRADIFTNANGIFNFDGSYTGEPFADFLLGYINTSQRRIPLSPIGGAYGRWSTNLFVQDDWKFSPNLTFNLGLRYEPMGPFDQAQGKLATFDPTLGGGQGGIRVLKEALEHPELVAGIDYYKKLYPTLIFDYSDRLHKADLNTLAPRFGFAWTPGGRSNTVIRGGYGIFSAFTVLWYSADFNQPPFSIAERYVKANGPTWENPWPTTAAGTINTVNHTADFVTPYYQHWNLGVQREIPMNIALDISYVGKKGTKLLETHDANQPLTAGGPKPFPLFTSPLPMQATAGSSTYHGMQLRLERRVATGVTILTSYSWGKMLRDGTARDTYNRVIEKGPDTEDMTHRFSTSVIYPVPQIGGDGIVGKILGGWQLTAITRKNTGSPATPTVSGNFDGRNTLRDRPNIIGNPDLGSDANSKVWWNKAAFALPENGTFGNAGTGSLRQPGYFATDFSSSGVSR